MLSPREGTIKSGVGRIAAAALLPAFAIGLWELGCRRGWIEPGIMTSPSQAVVKGYAMLLNGTLWHHTWLSLQRLLMGFGLGATTGLVLGICTGYSRLFQRFLSPSLSLLAPVPVTAWIPVIIVVAGIGELAKILIIMVGCFFPVFFGTFNGIRSADLKLVEMAQVYGKRSAAMIFHILLPSASASILPALKTSLGFGWILLVAAEVVNSAAGLGWLMWDGRTYRRLDDVLVGMFTAGCLGAISLWLVDLVQRRILFWRSAFEGR